MDTEFFSESFWPIRLKEIVSHSHRQLQLVMSACGISFLGSIFDLLSFACKFRGNTGVGARILTGKVVC